MRIISEKELKVILEKHADWLRMKEGGERADLSNADLRNANLKEVNLRYANLSNANLYGANLNGARLIGTDLYGADLYGADLRYADLSRADLRNVNLSNVIVNEATSFYHLQCPEKGSFTAFKKCIFADEYVIVELFIPKSAKRSSATTRKCRCDKAKVVAFYDLEGNKLEDMEIACSMYDYDFLYELNKTVKVNNFDDDRWDECSRGIHFFMSFREAVDYQL